MSSAFKPAPFSLAGTGILSSYVASNPYEFARATQVAFWVQVILASGSPITSVTAKLQHRYNDGTNQSPYTDLVSDLGDDGTITGTLEVEHALFTGLSAPVASPGSWARFFLSAPYSILDLTVNVKANAQGIAGDLITVYPALGPLI